MSDPQRKRLYPGQAYNILTLFGAGLALFALAAIVILYILSAFQRQANPYLGIFIFLVFPALLVAGLVLIPIGMWRERVRQRHGGTRPLVIDLANPHHRNVLLTFGVGTSLFLLISTIGLYQAYHFTESVTFCGDVCHVVMKPEKTAHQNSAHARVDCVQCHIGPGAGWYVQSKLSGARQVVKTITNTFPRPIPTPIENLRPAQEVCEQCHWPEKFYAATQVTRDHYLGDQENSHWRLEMLVNVGGTAHAGEGRASGIHWHIDAGNRITYVAGDSARQAFDQVSWKRGNEEVVYTRSGAPMSDDELAAKRKKHLVRTLDCMDCHNRPAHVYKAPVTAVNEAMAAGRLPADLPWIKREAVKALSRVYLTEAGARDSIALALRGFYQGEGVGLPEAAVGAVQAIYAQNTFPEMKARWSRYPDNRGHSMFPGCFRCHGSDLATPDGRTISKDCDLCHTIVSQGFVAGVPDSVVHKRLEFQHPMDIGGAERETPCFECHQGDDSLY